MKVAVREVVMPHSIRASARATSLIAVALLVAACGPTGSQTRAPATGSTATQAPGSTKAAEGEPTPGTALTSCELVAPADIEAALKLAAGTVAAGTLEQQPTSLDPAANECTYRGDWGGLIVHVTPTDGPNVFDALVKAYGDTSEAVDVADGGLWFEANDRGYFLKGVVMVRLQFQFIADGTKFRDPSIAIGTAALAKV
jgi:hypothetical protein